jgi:hypothetical protein
MGRWAVATSCAARRARSGGRREHAGSVSDRLVPMDGLRVIEVVSGDQQLETDRLELGDRVAFCYAEDRADQTTAHEER